MGQLVDGKWQHPDNTLPHGENTPPRQFKRAESQFRDHISMEPGSPFSPEAGRYHLYISLACPWAHRTLIFHTLKGLKDIVSLSIVSPFWHGHGWTFAPGPGVIPDTINHADYLYQVYVAANAHYTGRVTVPVLWDKKTATIVSNESSEIIRMFNHVFDHTGATPGDYYPLTQRPAIDEINALVYKNINNGVYRAGFATTQKDYDTAIHSLFSTLDELEDHLSKHAYLVGNNMSEADWRLFVTLVRFDAVYVGHFKTNLKRLVDYPHLWDYTKALYHIPGIAQTVNLDHIKQHYYTAHPMINPNGIVPLGPKIDFSGRSTPARR